MKYNYKITVIMPALNEEKNIVKAVENVIESFDRIGISGEIIVMNDGSTDGTGNAVEGLIKKHSFIRLISHDKPEGIGASFWEGIKKSQGEVVTMLPGDGENDGFEILRYIPLMEQVDIVIPFVYNKEVRSWKRRMLSKLYKGIINLSFGMLLNYMNGTVIYRRCVLDGIDLKARGFFYQTELLIKCLKNGYMYAEVPYILKKRNAGGSKATTLKSLLGVMRGYLTVMVSVYLGKKVNGLISPDSVTALKMKEVN
ncbi:MAG: glycosyltransferase family 2 protein [Deltaproteobacteria bacterium]|nr:glycosyltransferase family 2 protein [Deltaproteobacteria bacterium]